MSFRSFSGANFSAKFPPTFQKTTGEARFLSRDFLIYLLSGRFGIRVVFWRLKSSKNDSERMQPGRGTFRQLEFETKRGKNVLKR